MARAQGINTNRIKVLGLMLSNGLVAFSGALLTQYQGNSDVNMGRGAIVIGLAAVVIGEALFGKRKNFALRLLTVAIGAVTYYIVMQVICSGLSTTDLKLFSALVVAAISSPFRIWKQNGSPVITPKEAAAACLKSRISTRPSTPAPSTKR